MLTLFALMSFFTGSASVPDTCSNVRDDHTVGIVLTLESRETLDAYVSPRTYEAMRAQGMAVTLVSGCRAYDADFGEDADRSEAYDLFTGWEISATQETKVRLVVNGLADWGQE